MYSMSSIMKPVVSKGSPLWVSRLISSDRVGVSDLPLDVGEIVMAAPDPLVLQNLLKKHFGLFQVGYGKADMMMRQNHFADVLPFG